MKIEKMPMSCDVSEPAFAEACGRLGVMPETATLICNLSDVALAQIIRDKYRCQLVLVPAEILKNQFTWAVEHGQNYVWSEGV